MKSRSSEKHGVQDPILPPGRRNVLIMEIAIANCPSRYFYDTYLLICRRDLYRGSLD
jgi:hypothetical protein